MESRPRVAITMGDAAGIGPEIIVRSLADPVAATWAIPVVLGDARVLERAMDVAGVRLSLRRISRPAEAEGGPGALDIVDYANIDPGTHRWGEVRASNGAAAVHYTREAGRFALAGEIDAMVSAPLNKEAMHAAGYPYEGQTEILGELTGSRPAMVMVVDRMRVMLFTNHMALRAVCDYVRKDRVLDRLVLADAALRDMGIARPRLVVAGLNPHAGESGAFGREEQDEIVPAIAAARERGIDAEGPFPADTVFLKAFAGEFDGVLSMYHDQGQIASKLKGFNRGVTVTAGLKTVFTTPAHGTAFDIVGQGRASTGALEQAVRIGARLAQARRNAPASTATPLANLAS